MAGARGGQTWILRGLRASAFSTARWATEASFITGCAITFLHSFTIHSIKICVHTREKGKQYTCACDSVRCTIIKLSLKWLCRAPAPPLLARGAVSGTEHHASGRGPCEASVEAGGAQVLRPRGPSAVPLSGHRLQGNRNLALGHIGQTL